MCGIIGIAGQSDVGHALYDGLTVLQHRGQDAAGIATWHDQQINQSKGKGLIRDVFQQSHMSQLVGNLGIAHCRYPTAGSSGSELAQPFYVNSPYGIALVHNGNLTNAEQLTKEVFSSDLRHIATDSDSEVLLNVFAHELAQSKKLTPSPEDVFAAVRQTHKRCSGAYAFLAMIANYGIVGVRDPYGIRPLCVGVRQTADGKEYMLASESVALDSAGFESIGDVAPGEAVFIDQNRQIHREQCAVEPRLAPCLFEYVYLARPDSFLDDISVYKARLRMGAKLAEKIERIRPDIRNEIDVIMPIPDSGRTAALQLAHDLDIKFREGFIKNRYIGRTFIMPGQAERQKSVRKKLNPIGLEFKGKSVMLVDDSIVRGTTCGQIIQMARDAGAKKVYFASAAPPVTHPNVYGIDMPSSEELIAHDRTVEQIQTEIGADWLVYQDLNDLIEACRIDASRVDEFETSVFSGNYITGDIDDAYLDRLHAERNDKIKAAREDSISSTN